MHAGLAAKERDKFLRDVILALQDHLIKEWFTFGLYLDLSVNELYVLETNSLAHADKRTIVRHMLITWKDKFGQEATWDKIVDALKKIKQNSLARDLEGKYLQSAEVEETGECYNVLLLYGGNTDNSNVHHQKAALILLPFTHIYTVCIMYTAQSTCVITVVLFFPQSQTHPLIEAE